MAAMGGHFFICAAPANAWRQPAWPAMPGAMMPTHDGSSRHR